MKIERTSGSLLRDWEGADGANSPSFSNTVTGQRNILRIWWVHADRWENLIDISVGDQDRMAEKWPTCERFDGCDAVLKRTGIHSHDPCQGW